MSSQERILQLVKSANPLAGPLQVNDVDFSLPEVIAVNDKNTRVVISAKPYSGYVGSVAVEYNRHSLSEFGSNLCFVLDQNLTIETLLKKLNSILQSDLTAEDLADTPLPTYPAGFLGSVALEAAASSLEWYGTLSLNVLIASDTQTQSDATLEAIIAVQQQVTVLENVVGVGGQSLDIHIQSIKINTSTDDFFLGQAVYALTGNAIGLAKANDPAKKVVVGLVCQDIIESGSGLGKIQTGGILTGTTPQWEFATSMVGGLVPNLIYYLDIVKGHITPFAPSEDGLFLTVIGTAISTTELSINIERPITL